MARSTLSPLLLILLCLLLLHSATAHAFKMSGRLNGVYDRAIGPIPIGNTIDSKVDMEGRLRLKTKYKYHVRGVFALDASAYDREVIPSRLYMEWQPNKTWRLRMGYTKKIVGLEYEQNKMERLTIHRSSVYQKMKRSGLVGRQLAVGIRFRPCGSKRNTLSLALSHDGSRNSNVTYSAVHKFSGVKGLRAGVWGIVEIRKFKTVGRLIVFANALALWYQKRSVRFALEMVHGIDPDLSHYQMLFENSRKVHFLGPRLEGAYRFRLADKVSLYPLAQTSLTFDDLESTRLNSLQFLVGLNLRIQKIVLSINAETIGTKAPKNVGQRRFERKSIYAELVYYF